MAPGQRPFRNERVDGAIFAFEPFDTLLIAAKVGAGSPAKLRQRQSLERLLGRLSGAQQFLPLLFRLN